MVGYVALTVGLVFAVRLAHREPDMRAPHAATAYRGVLTFATTGNGDPFHPTVVQDLDLASGQLTVRFDGLDATRTRSGELAFVQRLAPGYYADHGVVVVDARGVPGAPVFVCQGFNVSNNRTCAVPKLAPNGAHVAYVTVGSGTVCDGGYGMKWGSSVVVADRRGAEVARFEGYSFPEWLPQVNTPAAAPASSPDGRSLAALMFDVSMPVRSLALFRPGDSKSVVFRDLGVYPYGPISWR